MHRIYRIPKDWWRGLPVTHKIYAVVGIMAFMIATELVTLLFAMNTLSAVRALVHGEALWSKAQKDAVHEIQNYATSRDEKHYQAMLKHLEIPLGDHQARMEMMNPNMDIDIVYAGFAKGQIHPDDIVPVINLLVRFHHISYIQRATEEWVRGDEMVIQLIDIAKQLHDTISRDPAKPDEAKIKYLLQQVAIVNDKLTQIETAFSSILGEASRWMESLLIRVLLTLVVTVEGTGLMLTFFFSRTLKKSLNELQSFANGVGTGDLNRVLPIRSNDELGKLAGALNKMAADLKETVYERRVAERSSQIKNMFLANMSHEIRTPLNSILGFVDLLKEPSIDEADKKKYLEIIERTGHSVATIINDILDISKVEAGKLEIEKSVCNLKQILNDMQSLLNLRCEAKGIYLKIDAQGLPERIITDGTRLKQILLNVIGNAIKFTEKGGVTVEVKTMAKHLVVTVNDTGPGIEPLGKRKLFQPFSQLDLSISKKFGGTGLGLILSKRLAQLMGGNVELERSEVGVGSTFVISVMFEEPMNQPQKAVPAQTTANALHGKTVLVVEDSLDNQILAEQYLSRAGAHVIIANHGQEAVELSQRMQYDIVLMDMQMPIMDGYTATQELRRLGCKVPIIALTAHAMKEDLDKCLSAGCNSYLSKPYRRDGLIAMINEQCSGAA